MIRWAVAALLVVGLAGSGSLDGLERALSDARARLVTRPASGSLVVVGIDAESLGEIGRWPWSRRVHADLVDRLAEAGVRRIALDIDFSAAADPEGDAALARALARLGTDRVALAGYRAAQPVADGPARLVQSVPLPALARHAELVAVNVVPDPDGLVRRYPTEAELAGRVVPSLALWALGRSMEGPASDVAIDYGIDVATIPYFPATDISSGRADPHWLRDRTVLLGAVDPALGDIVATPRYRALPGVMVHALAAETILQGRVLHSIPATATAPLLGLLLLLAGRRLERIADPILVAVGLAAPVAIVATALLLDLVAVRAVELAPFLVAWLVATVVVVARRLRELRAARAASAVEAERRRRLFEGVVASSFDGILTIDADGRVLSANPVAQRLLGAEPAALLGRPLGELAPALLPALPEPGEASRRGEATFAPAGERRRTLATVATRLNDPMAGGEILVLVLEDVSEARASAAALERLRDHDEATGLPSRSRLETSLGRMLGGTEPSSPVACLAILLPELAELEAVDGPRAVADALRAAADRLRSALPNNLPLAKVGAGALAIALPEHPSPELAARLVAALAQSGGGQVGGAVCLGLAAAPEHATDAAGLVRAALLAARSSSGRPDGIAVYAPAEDRRRTRELALVGALRTALAERTLDVVYQPKVDTWTLLPVGLEALVRWRDPRLGPVSPAEFVPLAEARGLIGPLTRRVLERVVADQAALEESGLVVPIAVNLSGLTIGEPRAAAALLALLREIGGRPQRLSFEVTETAVARTTEDGIACLRTLREGGYAIALDDFGAGYSSFALLRELPLDSLKIDRALVCAPAGDRSGEAVLASVIELAGKLGLASIGEGVEDERDLERLRRLGCDSAQGYLLGRPMPVDALIAWAREHGHVPTARVEQPAAPTHSADRVDVTRGDRRGRSSERTSARGSGSLQAVDA